jgi:hypothetical protein
MVSAKGNGKGEMSYIPSRDFELTRQSRQLDRHDSH